MFSDSFKIFDDDPFFSGFPSSHFNSLMPAEQSGARRTKNKADSVAKHEDPFKGFFFNMNTVMSDMHSRMSDIERNPDAHCFTSSTVMSYQNDGKSKPKLIQASSSTRRAPGQVKETRRTYRNSEQGIEKMAIGHHIGRRGHEIEKRRERGGPLEEENRLFDLNEDDLPSFDKEWQDRTSSFNNYRRGKIGGTSYDARAARPIGRQNGAARPIGPGKGGRR